MYSKPSELRDDHSRGREMFAHTLERWKEL